MLCEAAEVEHCLMCTDLDGAFSLKQRTDEDLTPAELEAVRRWRATSAARPATARAEALREFRKSAAPMSEEERRILFGPQDNS